MVNVRKIILAATSVLLIWIAAPNFLAAVWMAVGQPVLNDIEAGKTLTPEDIQTLVESREKALEFSELSNAATELGIAYLLQDQTAEGIEKALASVRRSTELAPMDGLAWMWRARLAIFSPDQEQEAATAWRTARALSEHHAHFLYDRIYIGTLVYRGMEQEDRDNLYIDVERAYKKNRGSLKYFAKQRDILEWMKFILRDEEKTKYLSS